MLYRFPRLASHPEAAATLMAALSVPLATLPLEEGRVKAVLLSYLEANTAAFPCHVGEDLDEEIRTLLLLYLVS
jgi:hypothetical protein